MDLAEGTKNEVALHHSRMGNGELGGGEVEVAVEEDVDINGAVGVGKKGNTLALQRRSCSRECH